MVNVLVILGYVWGFESVYSSTVSPHQLPSSLHSALDPVKRLHVVPKCSWLYVPKIKNSWRMKHVQERIIFLENYPQGMSLLDFFKQKWGLRTFTGTETIFKKVPEAKSKTERQGACCLPLNHTVRGGDEGYSSSSFCLPSLFYSWDVSRGDVFVHLSSHFSVMVLASGTSS